MTRQSVKCRCLEPTVFGHTCALAPDFVRDHARERVREEKLELRHLAARLAWHASATTTASSTQNGPRRVEAPGAA